MKRRTRKDATVENFFREVFDSLAKKVLEESAAVAPPVDKVEVRKAAAAGLPSKRRRKDRTH